jgi:hypothetical protein
MAELRSKTGLLNYRDGTAEPARFYYAADEAEPQNRSQIDPENHATWIEDDGVVGIRRGTSTSVGASAAYAANYDAIDWGN